MNFILSKKEYSCEHRVGNEPPVANAGVDQVIVLPKDSVLLDGCVSSDAEEFKILI